MITVLDAGRSFSFGFDAMMAYHGPSAPGGVAHAIKLMELAFPRLSPDAPPERREITIDTSFTGQGVRDTFELVTRAVTGDRYDVRPEHGASFEDAGYRQRFVFHIGYRGKTVTLLLREGIVRDAFLELVGKGDARSKDDDMQLAWLKEEMTERVMKLHASAVYEVVAG
jgi:hypothetical protein